MGKSRVAVNADQKQMEKIKRKQHTGSMPPIPSLAHGMSLWHLIIRHRGMSQFYIASKCYGFTKRVPQVTCSFVKATMIAYICPGFQGPLNGLSKTEQLGSRFI